MIVKFIKGAAGIGLAYTEGMTADHFTETQINELMESGYVIPFVEEKKEVVEIETAKVVETEEVETATKKTKKGN